RKPSTVPSPPEVQAGFARRSIKWTRVSSPWARAWDRHEVVELTPLQSTRALRLHRPLRGRPLVHPPCPRPPRARTGAQPRPWREVHRGPASGAAGVSGSVPVGGEGAGARICGEATYARAEGSVDRQGDAGGERPVRALIFARFVLDS